MPCPYWSRRWSFGRLNPSRAVRPLRGLAHKRSHMNAYPGSAGTMTLRLPVAVATFGVLAAGSLALAQAPSFTTIPNGITQYMSPSVSPNGRYVASVSLVGISDLLYRYDRSTGATVQ